MLLRRITNADNEVIGMQRGEDEQMLTVVDFSNKQSQTCSTDFKMDGFIMIQCLAMWAWMFRIPNWGGQGTKPALRTPL